MTKIMESNAAVTRTRNTGGFQYPVEGLAKRDDRILLSA
jgi:hypothetical protein